MAETRYQDLAPDDRRDALEVAERNSSRKAHLHQSALFPPRSLFASTRNLQSRSERFGDTGGRAIGTCHRQGRDEELQPLPQSASDSDSVALSGRNNSRADSARAASSIGVRHQVLMDLSGWTRDATKTPLRTPWSMVSRISLVPEHLGQLRVFRKRARQVLHAARRLVRAPEIVGAVRQHRLGVDCGLLDARVLVRLDGREQRLGADGRLESPGLDLLPSVKTQPFPNSPWIGSSRERRPATPSRSTQRMKMSVIPLCWSTISWMRSGFSASPAPPSKGSRQIWMRARPRPMLAKSCRNSGPRMHWSLRKSSGTTSAIIPPPPRHPRPLRRRRPRSPSNRRQAAGPAPGPFAAFSHRAGRRPGG